LASVPAIRTPDRSDEYSSFQTNDGLLALSVSTDSPQPECICQGNGSGGGWELPDPPSPVVEPASWVTSKRRAVEVMMPGFDQNLRSHSDLLPLAIQNLLDLKSLK
jgi:hypothetical protein